MKKANLKKFVQKMLILGFCVPVTLVCSAIPAMAEAATDTTVTNSGQQVSEQSTTTEASRENNDVNTVYTADKFLGQAVNYGIVANRFELNKGDAETNVAAKTGVCVNQTGNDLTSEKDKQEFMLGTVENVFKIKGNKDVTLYTPKEVTLYTQSNPQGKVVNLDGTTIQFKNFSSDDINAAINTLMQDVKTQSDACLQKARDEGSLKATVEYRSDQKYHLDLPSNKPGTYFVTLDKTIFSPVPGSQNNPGKFKQDEELLITAGKGQSIVFNVNDDFLDAGKSFQLQKFKWNGTGSDATEYLGGQNNKPDDSLATSVIWNLPNVNTLNINGSVAGVIYAPKAIVNVNRTSSGWIVANQVNIMDGEWHNISQYQFKPTSPESIIPQNTPSTDETTTPTDKTTTTTPSTDETTTPTDKTTTTTPSTDKTTTSTDKTTTTTPSTDKTTTTTPSTDKTTTTTPSTDKTTTSTDKTTTSTQATPTTTDTQTTQTTPTTPTTPTQPTTPTTPTTPATPSVDVPTVPAAPNTPSTPNAKTPSTSKQHTAAVQKTTPAKATAPTSSASSNTSIPKTGDQTNLLLYAVLFGGAAAALAAVLMLKKKERE